MQESTIRNPSVTGFYPASTELETKQETIEHNWNNFLQRIRVLIKRNDADFFLENENSMVELYESLERLIGAPKYELKDSEAQIDSHVSDISSRDFFKVSFLFLFVFKIFTETTPHIYYTGINRKQMYYCYFVGKIG